ncbi:hopanoid biosynthesis-associated protein HpnK [Methylocystis heyeri]|uniref:Hopanoid biosynthesis-associated protein HpnK n=1 Tax=Methylocystis heyeri TaxID=391905 RepID=A0A6B8KHP0_9HYPH|nr:hopanoid biosynthesis-associated protein HpnK [Methylocystis heyeri]QGM47177.1 hopanoid biosynthesis-associated protein HpnK [Methylocystis heyeri]
MRSGAPQGRPPCKRLATTADDFGLAMEVNEAVEAAHRRGFLTAASLMVGAAAAQDAIARARKLPELAVGLHVVAVEGKPALAPNLIPALVDATGNLRRDLVRFGVDIALGRETRRQLVAEITAQFELFERSGLALSHVDAHKHFLLHPIVADMILSVGSRFGMRVLRVPCEPRAILAKCEKLPFAPADFLFEVWALALKRKAMRAGLLVPDAVYGRRWSGAFDRRRMAALIRAMAPGWNEIYCHPATSSRFAGSAAGYEYEAELDALLAPDTAGALEESGFRLANRR